MGDHLRDKRIFLIDANSLIHRAFHALPPLTSPSGAPVQALYGVASILLRLWKDEHPRYVGAFFDRPEPTFRKERYAAYKAQRAKAPDELIVQIIEAHRLFAAFGIPVYEAPGWEADDLLAAAAEKFKHLLQAVILTGDLDTLQLVEDGKIIVWALKTGISEVVKYDEAAVRARYGLEAKQLPDYKALVGDPSDNVKGVPGVGPKTAAGMLQRFGTLERLYAAAPGDEKLRAKLLPFREEAELSKMLVTLRADAPLPVENIAVFEVAENLDNAKKYFESFGFQALIKRMEGGVSESKVSRVSERSVPVGLFAKVPTKAGLPSIASAKEGPLPTHVFAEEFSSAPSGALRVGFDVKEKLKSEWKKEGDIKPPYWDLGAAAWLLDADAKNYDPASVAERFLKMKWDGGEEQFEKLFEWEYRTLSAHGLLSVFETIEMPLVRVLAEMEHKGIVLSKERLEVLLQKVDERLSLLERGIYRHAGEEFNLNSPREVSRILFEKLGIRGKSITRTGLRSTREEALLSVAEAHPIVKEILEYREFFKVRSTYLAPLLDKVGKDGRVHTEFVQTSTGTGRLSSREPNLQNIPQSFIWAKELRAAFLASEGKSLVAFDYAQLELRILAALSEDEELTTAFKRGEDLHRLTAARVLNIAPEAVGEKERRLAKTLNFGLMYGMGARAFAQAAGVSAEEAKKFIAQYFKTFSKVKKWQEAVREEARNNGFVSTLTGRRRYLPAASSPLPHLRAEAERAAVNFPIQGLGADLIKISMVRIRELFYTEKWAEGGDAALLLSIHDELLFEIRDDMIHNIAPRVRSIMESAYSLSVPLTVKISAGKDWGNLHGYTATAS